MQNSTTFVQTAEVKQKYEGKFTHIGEFNRKFEARLRQRNPLAMSIINGTIKLKPVATKHKTYYEHAVAIITAFFLAIQIMITVDQTTINYARLPFTRLQYRTVHGILTDDTQTEAERVAELFARITEIESSSDDDDSDDGNSTAKRKPKPKRKDPNAVSEDDVENIIKYLNTMEEDDHKRN